MGSTISQCCDKIKTAAEAVNKTTHEFLDGISNKLCPEKPTLQLALLNMNIPQKDLDILGKMLHSLHAIFEIIVTPAKALSDKKFSTHLYESTSFFRNMTGQIQHKNTVSCCEKMLMYISCNINSLVEPREKQIRQTINIEDDTYDLPVNLWYTLIVNNIKVYFYVHVSVLEGYQGVLLATNTLNATIFDTIKQEMLNNYNRTLGQAAANTDQTIDDIL